MEVHVPLIQMERGMEAHTCQEMELSLYLFWSIYIYHDRVSIYFRAFFFILNSFIFILKKFIFITEEFIFISFKIFVYPALLLSITRKT